MKMGPKHRHIQAAPKFIPGANAKTGIPIKLGIFAFPSELRNDTPVRCDVIEIFNGKAVIEAVLKRPQIQQVSAKESPAATIRFAPVAGKRSTWLNES